MSTGIHGRKMEHKGGGITFSSAVASIKNNITRFSLKMMFVHLMS